MKLIQRIGYYLGGFSMGLIFLAFFLSGKKTSCSYGPDARVLKNINSKTIVYSPAVSDDILEKLTDSIEIATVLKKGDINFSESSPRKKPCGIYVIEGLVKEKNIILTVQNCDKEATVISYKVKI